MKQNRPSLAITRERDQIEAEIRGLLIKRGFDPNDPLVYVTVALDDHELALAIFRWQQMTNRVRRRLGLYSAPPEWPSGYASANRSA